MEDEHATPPTRDVPVSKVGPTAAEPSLRPRPLSSPLFWLALLGLIAAVIAYLLLGPTRDITYLRELKEMPAQQ
jgi:hypothetical protein